MSETNVANSLRRRRNDGREGSTPRENEAQFMAVKEEEEDDDEEEDVFAVVAASTPPRRSNAER